VDKALQQLLQQLSIRIEDLMTALEQGMTPAVWAQQFSSELAAYHQAALLVSGQPLTEPAADWLTKMLGTQLQFLGNFQLAIESEAAFQEGWKARAQMYGQAIGASYEAGRTRMLPLPAMPKDGSTFCLSHCTCFWDLIKLDGNENYDCHWRLGATDHCTTCKARARLWAPLKIREGRLV
jgi:plasmid maintenance system antidote protein VapI